jgi:hypothetical protein
MPVVADCSFQVHARSAAAPDAVFAALADVPRWHEWAGPLIVRSEWARTGAPEPGGVGAVRKVGAFPVWAREEIVAYDPPRHLAYVMLSGQPVRNYRADVEMAPDGDGTRITWRATFRPLVPGTGAVLERFFERIIQNMANRLAARAEVSPSAGA